MKRHPVESSDLESVGWENGVLEVCFKAKETKSKGLKPAEVYRYFEVPEQVLHELRSAKSPGQYFFYKVRNRYRYERIGVAAAA